ncbi:MAG: hypothetical protein ACFFCS_03725 [Candidatus Hodarchaeota archaeon]
MEIKEGVYVCKSHPVFWKKGTNYMLEDKYFRFIKIVDNPLYERRIAGIGYIPEKGMPENATSLHYYPDKWFDLHAWGDMVFVGDIIIDGELRNDSILEKRKELENPLECNNVMGENDNIYNARIEYEFLKAPIRSKTDISNPILREYPSWCKGKVLIRTDGVYTTLPYDSRSFNYIHENDKPYDAPDIKKKEVLRKVKALRFLVVNDAWEVHYFIKSFALTIRPHGNKPALRSEAFTGPFYLHPYARDDLLKLEDDESISNCKCDSCAYQGGRRTQEIVLEEDNFEVWEYNFVGKIYEDAIFCNYFIDTTKNLGNLEQSPQEVFAFERV